MLKKTEILQQLEQFSKAVGKIVIVHTSLKAIGETEGGGATLLDALIEYFSPHLDNLCEDCAKNKESSSAAALIAKTNVLKNYFTDPCTLSVHHGFLQGTYSDVRIANEIMRVNLFFENSELSYSDLMLEIDMPQATAVFSGRFRAVLKGGEKVDEVREVELKLRKVDKKWKIYSAEVHKILSK